MKHQQSSIALLVSLMMAVSIYSQGCTRKSTPPVEKADVEMIGSDSLEPVTSGAGSSPLSDSSSSGIAELPLEDGSGSGSFSEPSVSASPEPRSSASASSRSSTTRSTSSSGSSTGTLSRQAARAVSDNLIQEQEDFFFKRATETRAHYESPEGELMIPSSTLATMQGMIDGRFPVELKISCDAFNFTVPRGTSDRLVSSIVEVLGDKVQAKIFESETETRPVAEANLTYRYKMNAGEQSPESSSLTVNRVIHYRLASGGNWVRTGVDEKILSEEKPKPRSKAATPSKKTTARAKSKPKATTAAKKAKPPKTEVEGAGIESTPVVPRGDVMPSGAMDSPRPSGGSVPKVESSPALEGASVPPQPTTPPPPTSAPAPPPAPEPTPKPAAPSSPPPAEDLGFDESLIPDVPMGN